MYLTNSTNKTVRLMHLNTKYVSKHFTCRSHAKDFEY